MQCKHCGTEVHPAAELCWNCGGTLSDRQVRSIMSRKIPLPVGDGPRITPSEVILLSVMSLVEPVWIGDMELFRQEAEFERTLAITMFRAAMIGCEADAVLKMEMRAPKDNRQISKTKVGSVTDGKRLNKQKGKEVWVVFGRRMLAYPQDTLEARLADTISRLHRCRFEELVYETLGDDSYNPSLVLAYSVRTAFTSRGLLVTEKKGLWEIVKELVSASNSIRQRLTDEGRELAAQYRPEELAMRLFEYMNERPEYWRGMEAAITGAMSRRTDTTPHPYPQIDF